MADAGLQLSVIGEDDETFRVFIQTTGRIDFRDGDIALESR
jgi:hypothetical protein